MLKTCPEGRRYNACGVAFEVHKRAESAGGVRALARQWGIPPSLISDTINGRRPPSPSILAKLGLVEEVWYAPIPPREEQPK
jgi:hypothetical protein